MVLALAAMLAAWVLLGQGGPTTVCVKVQESGVLRVGLEATFPPFETTDGAGQLWRL